MLSPIREFAAARLHECGNESRLGEQHAIHFTEFAKSLNPRTRHTMKQVLARFDAERQNFAKAWEWIRAHDRWDLGSSLINSLVLLFELRHAFEEWQRWLVEAAEHADALEPPARWAILWKAAAPFEAVHNEVRAEQFARRALEVAEALGEPGRISASLERLAGLRLDVGDIDGALELFERAREHADEAAQFLPVFAFYNNVGLARAIAGQYERALAEYTRALQEARAVTNDLVQAGIVHNVAEVLLETGDIEGADSRLREAIELADQLDYWEVAAGNQLLVARIALARNDDAAARKSLAVALEYFAGAAQPLQITDTLKEVAHYLSRTSRGRESLMVLAFLRKHYRPQRELPTLRDRHRAAEAELRAAMTRSEIDDCRRIGEELNLDEVLSMLVQSHAKTHIVS
jgi:tetratricopeptide (TPR) repeat protein